jgi:hypothetical protein
VDSGNFLNDETSAHGSVSAGAAAKDEWVLKAYDEYPVAVANLSEHELPFISKVMRKTEVDKWPILRRVVSANVTPDSTELVKPAQFIVREIPDRQAAAGHDARPIRIGFVGLSEADQPAPKGFRIADPVQTAKRVVPEVRGKADLVVVLAHGKADVAARLASEVTGIDVLIIGNGELFTRPVRMGRTLIVFTAHETRMLGELRFYRGPESGFSIKDRYISLDNDVPDDPAAMKLIEGQKAAVKAVFDRSGPQPIARVTGDAAPSAQAGFVSAQACSKCHLAEYMQWLNTGHARALSSLAGKRMEFDTGCLACHTTGSQKGGFRTISETPGLTNVQCEQCHGPGRDHVAKPSKDYGHIADMAVVCSTCHTEETSAGFNAGTFWQRIKHK